MRKKELINLLFLLLLFNVKSAFSQKTELGFMVGPSYYYGDIVNTFQPLTAGIAASAFARYHLSMRTSVRANLSYGLIRGSDDIESNSEWQRVRNMDFRTHIIEGSGIMEYNLRPDENRGRRVKTSYIPYIFGGIGFIYFESYRDNPITGESVALRPLQLDGTNYAPIAICVPFGYGMRFYMNRNWTIGFEIGARWTSTSQLDNVDGQSIYPAAENLPSDLARLMYDPSVRERARPGKPRGKIDFINDLYVLSGVTLSYRIWPTGVRPLGGKLIPCPRIF